MHHDSIGILTTDDTDQSHGFLFARLFARMVGSFEVRADVFECQPGRFELAARVERSLVCVVFALWISAGAERVDRQCPHSWSKFDHADVSSTGDAVSPFLSALGRSIKREYRAVVTIHTAYSEARPGVVKI